MPENYQLAAPQRPSEVLWRRGVRSRYRSPGRPRFVLAPYPWRELRARHSGSLGRGLSGADQRSNALARPARYRGGVGLALIDRSVFAPCYRNAWRWTRKAITGGRNALGPSDSNTPETEPRRTSTGSCSAMRWVGTRGGRRLPGGPLDASLRGLPGACLGLYAESCERELDKWRGWWDAARCP